MPLLKRKLFSLADPPKDLEPDEFVYQVRFTKEIFRDYHEYLCRVNLYRQRVWACKVTGKINMTYEEALVSEKLATDKVQQLPKELVVPALRIIQHSTLSLKDLADTIAAKLQDYIQVGAELYVKKDNSEYQCRILKVIDEGCTNRYKIARLDRNKKVVETLLVNREELIQKKPPFSRNIFKSFIRESTYRSAPWVIHDKLAQKHQISTELPRELRSKFLLQNGVVVCSKKRKKSQEDAMAISPSEFAGDDLIHEEPIKYPIEDLLVKPSADDPVFSDRPVPVRDFNVPMKCVGDLLMVWDFCMSFGRLLLLSPYSLEDFESAICQEKGNVSLVVETHASLLRVLINHGGEYFLAVQKRLRTSKITLVTWQEYLCDWLETMKVPELRSHISTIRRGHYGILDAQAKLRIFRELIACALDTDTFRDKLGEIIEQRSALGATRREEALEQARKRREKKEVIDDSTSMQNIMQNGDKSGSKKLESGAKTTGKKPNLEENGNNENDGKEKSEKTTIKERREEYEREMEKRFVRSSPLGKDRDYNRYWWFRRAGRIFVESSDSAEWGYFSSKEELDALMGSLNCKGERERDFKMQLEKFYSRISGELQKRRKDLRHKDVLEEAMVRRSTRVRAPPRQNPANAFLKYVNKWKEE